MELAEGVVEAEIFRLLEARELDASICPSEVARSLGGDHWRELMDGVREVAGRLAAAGRVSITQGEATVDVGTSKGPIRIRRP
ncbi:MAG: DUF3253 domain-containing protein [Sporichthyaceae bacterium]